MNEKIFPSPMLQTFYVSRETSNCPMISEMIKLGKTLDELGFAEKDTGVISLDYGKRLLINAKNIDITTMKQQDIVEIVDYDVLKNVMMVIGTKDPCFETPVHWVVQKARHDINALLQLNSKSLYEKLVGTLPSTGHETKPNTFDSTREILTTLRMSKTILIKNQGIFFGGVNIKEIQESLKKYLGALK
jgi:hypothetical protein